MLGSDDFAAHDPLLGRRDMPHWTASTDSGPCGHVHCDMCHGRERVARVVVVVDPMLGACGNMETVRLCWVSTLKCCAAKLSGSNHFQGLNIICGVEANCTNASLTPPVHREPMYSMS